MNTWKVILATLVIFGAGVITGGLLVSHSDRAARQPVHRISRLDRLDSPLSDSQRTPVDVDWHGINVRENEVPPALRKDFLDRLNRELTLSPEQRERIEKVISQGQERTRDLWRAEMRVTRQKIRTELTPEQQTRFQELLKQRPTDRRRLATPDHLSTNSSESTVSSNPAAAP